MARWNLARLCGVLIYVMKRYSTYTFRSGSSRPQVGLSNWSRKVRGSQKVPEEAKRFQPPFLQFSLKFLDELL